MAHANTVEIQIDRATAALITQVLFSWDGWLNREQRTANDAEAARVDAVTALIIKQLA